MFLSSLAFRHLRALLSHNDLLIPILLDYFLLGQRKPVEIFDQPPLLQFERAVTVPVYELLQVPVGSSPSLHAGKPLVVCEPI